MCFVPSWLRIAETMSRNVSKASRMAIPSRTLLPDPPQEMQALFGRVLNWFHKRKTD